MLRFKESIGRSMFSLSSLLLLLLPYEPFHKQNPELITTTRFSYWMGKEHLILVWTGMKQCSPSKI